MKNILTLSLCIIFVTVASSQKEFNKAQFGISVFPHVGTLSSGEGNGKGLPGLGYGIGIGFQKSVSKNVAIQSGFDFQKTPLRQRFNNFRWPDDQENGEWVPGRSHEQYEVEYFALGFSAGVNVRLNQKENFWSWVGSGSVRHVFDEKDKLIINESGSFREYSSDEIETELNKTQYGIATGLLYNIPRFSMGPIIEYTMTNLLSNKKGTFFWSYEGGRPVFLHFKASYFFI